MLSGDFHMRAASRREAQLPLKQRRLYSGDQGLEALCRLSFADLDFATNKLVCE